MSRQLHRAIRLNLCRGPWKDQRRPILINNWEATLFDFDAEKICSIAKAASQRWAWR
ncbi:MAG: alpha-galactosidase [Oscillospiraceae bacterium]